MLVLRTDSGLSPEAKEILRKEVKDHMGEDCVILSHGLRIERIPCAKDKTAPISRVKGGERHGNARGKENARKADASAFRAFPKGHD